MIFERNKKIIIIIIGQLRVTLSDVAVPTCYVTTFKYGESLLAKEKNDFTQT